MDILRLENCSVCYKNGVKAVDDVTFSVREQEIVCIVGESGSGKTTVIRAVLGILPSGGRVTGGHIWFDKLDLATATEQKLQEIRGRHISMIFQDTGGSMDPIKRIKSQYQESIRAHAKLPASVCRMMGTKMLAAMHMTDPDRVMESFPFELSGGMKQRVGIAMSMTARPKILLADEPTSALDVTIQAQVVRQMKQLRHEYGAAIIIVTHNMGVASYISDKIGVMKEGKLIEWGARDDIIFNPRESYTKELLSAVPRLEDSRLAK